MIDWHRSGAYSRQLADEGRHAMNLLDGYLRGETPQNFAIVLDIDETALSNWPYLRERDFGLTAPSFAEWTRRERALPIDPVRQIYARAKAYRIPIFFVTGRDESLRDATVRDLHEAGYFDWNGLYMRPSADRDRSVVPFKSGVRRMLTDHGYQIILNVGDQESDLAGGYAHHRVKLVNPFYFIP